MNHRYQDVNGPRIVSATEQALTLNGIAIWQGFALFPRVSADGRVAWKNHGTPDGRAMMFDGQRVIDLELGTEGNWPVAWHPNGTLYVQVESLGQWVTIAADGTRGVADQSADLSARNLLPAAQGIHHILADGTVILNNEPSVFHGFMAAADGQQIEGWFIANDAHGNRLALGSSGGPAGCVTYLPKAGTPLMWVAPTDIAHPPFISDGRAAISGHEPPPIGVPSAETGWVPWVAAGATPTPVPAPAPVQPVSPGTLEPAPGSNHAACRSEIARLRAQLSARTRDLATAEAASQALATELARATEQQRKQSEAIKQMPNYLRSVVEFYLKSSA